MKQLLAGVIMTRREFAMTFTKHGQIG